MSRNKARTHALITLDAIVLAIVIILILATRDCDAAGEPASMQLERVAMAVERLQPRLEPGASTRWAKVIMEAAEPNDLSPVLVAAFVRRESSFDPRVADGRIRGSYGELGCMQVLPGGVALRHARRISGCNSFEDQARPRCSLAAGSGYLAHLRDEVCPGSVWRWVSAYRFRSCPSEARARADRGAQVIRAFHCEADAEDCARVWGSDALATRGCPP